MRGVAVAHYPRRLPDRRRRRPVLPVDRGPAGAGRYPQRANGKRSRAEWFALFAVCGELGAVIGPVAGGVLSGIGFRHIALAGAGIFLLALAVLFFCLPADGHTTTTRRRVPWWTPLRQPRFVAFILAYSSWLLSYNQLYLALPVEIQRSGGREQDLAPLFMLASLLIITLQLLSPASPGEWAPCASCRWAFCCCRLPLPAWRYSPPPHPPKVGCG